MRTKLPITIIILALFSGLNSQAQDAVKKFGKIRSKKEMTNLISTSLPTLDDCNAIFKTKEDAEKYFSYSEESKSKIAAELAKPDDEKFEDINFETFTTEDISANKGNYAGGMSSLNGKIKPEIVFYKVELLREVGATTGVGYKYWVFVNNKWVFLPKPWSAFRS